MTLNQFVQLMLPAIEDRLQKCVNLAETPPLVEMNHMLAYHLGWEGEKVGPEARGKRIRPILLLLCTAAAGGSWPDALPAAAAVELVHNFSLVHDDIQDQSLTRRGRPAVWALWGAAQAINVGDALFALAQISLAELANTVSPEDVVLSYKVLNETCLKLTQGQYLDLAYESRRDLMISDYWPMIAGKTAALLSACTHIGAVCARADKRTGEFYREFGQKLGLAFQVQDDFLGIWGDSAQTGKSTASDLISGKKSLPVLYGLEQNGRFANRWRKGCIEENEVHDLADQLTVEGAFDYVNDCSRDLSEQAVQCLNSAEPVGEAGAALHELVEQLLHRNS